MSETMEVMTPQQLYAEECRLGRMWGTYVSIGVGFNGAKIYLSSHDKLDDYAFIEAETFQEAIAKADAHAERWKAAYRNTIIRKLALAIIEVTDEHTECTFALLRAKKFSKADIREFHEAACERASEMCGNAPFTVKGV